MERDYNKPFIKGDLLIYHFDDGGFVHLVVVVMFECMWAVEPVVATGFNEVDCLWKSVNIYSRGKGSQASTSSSFVV